MTVRWLCDGYAMAMRWLCDDSRRLQLARTLNDPHGKGDAYLQLGSLATASRAWGEAQHYYEQVTAS